MPRRNYDENSDTNARTQVQYVPCSGLLGHNITTSHKESKLEWYKGPTLTEAIDSLDTRKRFDDSPPRLFVSDVYPHKKDLIRVYGKIAAGSIGVKDRVLLMPLNLRCTSTCSRINTFCSLRFESTIVNLEEKTFDSHSFNHRLNQRFHLHTYKLNSTHRPNQTLKYRYGKICVSS